MTPPTFHATGRRLAAGIVLLLSAVGCGLAQSVVQTNYVTSGTVPGPYGVVTNDLLQTSLSSATRTGSAGNGNTYFYREDSGYTVDLGLLSNGSFGSSGTVSTDSVFPNQVTLTFNLDVTTNTAGYTLTGIRTYAGWDDGRDGQDYTVQYSLVSAPATYLDLVDITQYTPTEGYDDSHTLVVLTGSGGADLATGVASLRFVFTGFENGGTAYREFDVMGAATAVPEPGAAAVLAGLVAAAGGIVGRRRRSQGGGT